MNRSGAAFPGRVWYRVTSPGYLQQMRIRLLEGRYFTARDREGSAPVGIVNWKRSRKLWGGKSPIGRVLSTGPDSLAPRFTIVGVVATDLQDGPNQPSKAELFVPLGQLPSRVLGGRGTVARRGGRDRRAANRDPRASTRSCRSQLQSRWKTSRATSWRCRVCMRR